MSKLFGRFYCKVSGMMCRVRLRNPPVPSPYTVKETLRLNKVSSTRVQGTIAFISCTEMISAYFLLENVFS